MQSHNPGPRVVTEVLLASQTCPNLMLMNSFTVGVENTRSHSSRCLITAILVCFSGWGTDQVRATEAMEHFRMKVLPILSEHCIKCHGGEAKLRGGLSLIDRDTLLAGGDSGEAVNLQSPDKSYLLEMVSYKDADHEMPPNKGKLSPASIQVLEEWVELGLAMDLTAIEGAIDLFGVLPLDVPLTPDGGASQIQLRCRPHNEEYSVLRLEDRTGLATSGRTTGVVIDGGVSSICEHVIGDLTVLPGTGGLSVAVLPGKLAQFGLSVGKVTSVPEGTLPLEKVLAQRYLVELIRLRRRPAGHLPVLPGLHLTQSEGKVGHLRPLDAILPDVLVAAVRSVDAKALAVEHAFEPIGLGYVPEGTVLHLALVAVAAEGHLGQVVLVKELTRRALHAQVAKPVATHNGTEPRIVLGGRDHRLGIFTAGEDGPSLAVRQRIDRLGDTLGQGKVLEIVLHLIDRQRLGRKDRVVGCWHRLFVVTAHAHERTSSGGQSVKI